MERGGVLLGPGKSGGGVFGSAEGPGSLDLGNVVRHGFRWGLGSSFWESLLSIFWSLFGSFFGASLVVFMALIFRIEPVLNFLLRPWQHSLD